MDPPRDPSSVNFPLLAAPSSTLSTHVTIVQDQSVLITPAPELRLRNAAPEPQNGATDCSQASQSASQAIQQATQQANQSVQQAQQSASQAVQQATQQANQSIQQAQQSASQAYQQFSNQASQSIAAASRSVTSAISSASSAIASAQSSADQAVSRAMGSMNSAQASASTAESVLRAAVAAATGSAAAAGSSFLAAAAKATQGAQASISAFGAAATSQVAEASKQATVSQTVAITATEAALAIVGSIIASTLITITIYFLVIRHKKLVRRRSLDKRSLEYPNDPKFPDSDQVSVTLADSQTNLHSAGERSGNKSPVSSSPSGQHSVTDLRTSVVKTTTVPWNPAKPPKAPTIKSWLTLQQSVSPFGPINLPDATTPAPLGGQLKSPLQSTYSSQSKFSKPPPQSNTLKAMPFALKKQPSIANKVAVVAARPTIAVIAPKGETPPSRSQMVQNRESKASVWTDQSVEDEETPIPQPSPRSRIRGQPPVSLTRTYGMQLPEPVNNVRNTAEWLSSPSRFVSVEDRQLRTSVNPQENIGGTIGKAR